MRYFLGVLAMLFIGALAVYLIYSQPSSNNGSITKKNTGLVLSSYAGSDASVQQTTTGRLVGEEDRRAIRITVSRSQRTIDILGGYEETILSTQQITNTQAAYNAFLHALDNEGFTKSKKSPESSQSGVCPLGNQYNYTVLEGTNDLSNLWSTSCTLSDGTFNGNGPTIRQLFQSQINNYSQFVNGVQL